MEASDPLAPFRDQVATIHFVPEGTIIRSAETSADNLFFILGGGAFIAAAIWLVIEAIRYRRSRRAISRFGAGFLDAITFGKGDGRA